MERVLGIGGVFFRARDPEALKAWYGQHLGVPVTPGDYEDPPWLQHAGATVWEAFPADTDDFGAREQIWMVNFRVRDLNAMIDQLRAAGVDVALDPREYRTAASRARRILRGTRSSCGSPQGGTPSRNHSSV